MLLDGCRFKVCSGVEGGGEGRWFGVASFVEDEEGMSLKEVWEGCFGGDDGGETLVETMENGQHQFVIRDFVVKITECVGKGL